MRLIGGTIADTPVKEVGDGSAFSVGGASGAATLNATFVNSAQGFRKCNTGWDEPDWAGPHNTQGTTTDNISTRSGIDIEQLADNIHIIVWRSGSSKHGGADSSLGSSGGDGKIKAAIITFDSSGDPTFGAMQELNDFTTRPSQNVHVRRVSATRVVICNSANVAGFHYLELGTYDISGDTISLMSGASIQAFSPPSTSITRYDWDPPAFDMFIIDADRLIFTTGAYYYGGANSNGGIGYGVKFTPTQSVTSIFTSGAPSGTAANGATLLARHVAGPKKFFADPDGNAKVWFSTGSGYWSYSYSSADAPVITGPTLEVSLGAFKTGGNYNSMQKPSYSTYRQAHVWVPDAHRLEVGEGFHIGASPNYSAYYSGKDTDVDNTIGALKGAFTVQEESASAGYQKKWHSAASVVWLDKVDGFHRLIAGGTATADSGGPFWVCFNYSPSADQISIGKKLETGLTDYPLNDAGSARWEHACGDHHFVRAIKPKDDSKRITYLTISADTPGWAGWDGGEGEWVYATIDCLPPE